MSSIFYADDWYYSVTDASPGTLVFSTQRGTFVALGDAQYGFWLSKDGGNTPTVVATQLEMLRALARNAVEHYLEAADGGWVPTSALGAGTWLFITVPPYLEITTTSGANGANLKLPNMLSPTAIPIGFPYAIKNLGPNQFNVVDFAGTVIASLLPGEMLHYFLSNNASQAGIFGAQVDRFGRERLTAARTYYVRTDGSNSNDGMTNTGAGAFLTIQFAISKVEQLDLNGFTVTIQVGNGIYNENVLAQKPWVSGLVTLQGNTTTPASCTINGGGGVAIMAKNYTVLTVRGFKVQSSGQYGLQALAGGVIYATGKMEMGACSIAALGADGVASLVEMQTPWDCTGAGSFHMLALHGGQLVTSNCAITFTGSLNFPAAFCGAARIGLVNAMSMTFTGGTITGPRYDVAGNSLLFTNGGGASYFPGNAVGTATTGGQYL